MRTPTAAAAALLTLGLLTSCSPQDPTTTPAPSPTESSRPSITPEATATTSPTPQPSPDPTQILLDEARAFVIQVTADDTAAEQAGYRNQALTDASLAHYSGDARAAKVAYIQSFRDYNLTLVGEPQIVDVQLVDLQDTQYGPVLDLRICTDNTGAETLRDGASQEGGEQPGRTVATWTVSRTGEVWLVYNTEPLAGETC